MKLLTVNTRGIKSKITSLTTALHMHGTHIAAITETHLEEMETVQITGYQWVGRNRDKNGGGVGFLIRNDIKGIVTESESPHSEYIENMWIKVKCEKNTELLIGVIYGMQESRKKQDVERQFQELTTQTNRIQKKHPVIILGDFNAKVTINKTNCTQKESRNGTILNEFIKQTNTSITNITTDHEGTWTRINRRNSSERSVIDYIVISHHLRNKILESATDNNNTYLVAGANPTDHNVITTTINTKMVINKPNITQTWKAGNPEQWKEFNNTLQTKWKNTGTNNRNPQTLEKLTKESLMETIGEKITNKERKTRITNPLIKKAKMERKTLKIKFNMACKDHSNDKAQRKQAYVDSQKTVRTLIEEQVRLNTKKIVEQITRGGSQIQRILEYQKTTSKPQQK